MSRDLRHPVWRVYDEYRTSRLNVKYYCCVLQRVQRLNLALEVIVALLASGSALAGFTYWSTPQGKVVWQFLATGAAALAVAKPLVKYDKSEQQLQEVITGYRLIEHRLKKLIIAIERRGKYDAPSQEEFAQLLEDLQALVVKGPEKPTSKRLQRRCREEVERELPADSFFVPTKDECDGKDSRTTP